MLALLPFICLTSACVNTQSQPGWGGGEWPTLNKFGQAAQHAAVSPQTWAPLLTAGLLQIDDADKRWSRDLAEDQPLFGDNAKDVSNSLRDVATGAYVLTALFAESESYQQKARGLAVGAGTMVLDGLVNQGLKDAFGRDRPDDSNDQSMPSGHASKAASRTNMAIRNLNSMSLQNWQREGATWLLRGVAAGTGLARVEAAKHHLSDVLVGYAVGHFVSTFMYEAFMREQAPGLQLSFTPIEQGGALTLTVPLR